MSYSFKVGDLVNFIGYSYAPDYYYPDDLHGSMGIIIEKLSSPWTREVRVYRVYWFKTHNVTEVGGMHLNEVKPNKQTNYDRSRNQ